MLDPAGRALPARPSTFSCNHKKKNGYKNYIHSKRIIPYLQIKLFI